jgi:hypothetical protein
MRPKVILITPDRNDRPEFIEHCRYQMERQTFRAYDHLVINHDPVPGVVDIVPRVRMGVNIAADMKADYCMIIENDDYYPDNYVETVVKYLERFEIAGADKSIYYSLQHNCLKILEHPGRASLYLSAFRTESMKSFVWPEDTMLYFDIYLWANHQGRKGFTKFAYTPIGLKHGNGFTPGNFHNGVVNGKGMKGMIPDPGRNWLKSHTRKESFEFYQKLMP